jgi:ferredoxin-thioredoxin reductase catalytic subunit
MKVGETKDAAVNSLCEKIRAQAEASGYFLNPDSQFTRDLVAGLVANQERYGYPACPCRLGSGNRQEDLDIICPCDYRDADVTDYGACYCALYVSQAAAKGEKPITSVPERRPAPGQRAEGGKQGQKEEPAAGIKPPYPVWRCRVCGYLCAREEPPDICPICKVKKERFERFL